MKMLLKPLTPHDYYDQLDGDTPFALAVNKKVADYWVATGAVMPIESAAFEVLADLYDRLSPPKELT